jgi:hypothetical protein
MKLLRETIRKMILENQSHYDKIIALLVSNDTESIVQGIELADAMEYIQSSDYIHRERLASLQGGSIPAAHEWLIKPIPEFLDRYRQLHPNGVEYKDPTVRNIGWEGIIGYVELDGESIRIGRYEV